MSLMDWRALSSCEGAKEMVAKLNDDLKELMNEVEVSSETLTGKTTSGETNDRLSELPNDVLMSNVSSFTMKETARMSLLSHKWNYIWQCCPVLKFEDKRTIFMWIKSFDIKVLEQERFSFVEWVNHVVDNHLGPVVDELRVTFDLDHSCQSHIDKWLYFALSKQVKTLEFDLRPIKANVRKDLNYTLLLDLRSFLVSVKPSLTSLSLKFVNANAEDIKCLLHLCPFLENLCIEGSPHLISLSVSGSSLKLKYLGVYRCPKLKTLDIHAPNLLSLTYKGQPVKLNIEKAPLLSAVSIAGGERDPIAYAFDCLSRYFSQLTYLSLKLCLSRELNLRMDRIPASTSIKHLKLEVQGSYSQSLLGWTSLIEAFPFLEKLTVQMAGYKLGSKVRIDEREGCPLKCLKTLELGGFQGGKMDVELASYVFKNATALKEVNLGIYAPHMRQWQRHGGVEGCIHGLKSRLPQGVSLIINQSFSYK